MFFTRQLKRHPCREVYSHEFQAENFDSLREELLGNQSPPTQQEILDLIPPSKLIKANIK